MENSFRKILEEKSKIELQVLAKRIGAKGYTRLSKESLVEKLLVEKENHRKLKQELGLEKEMSKNPWLIGFVFLLLGIPIAVHFSSKSASKEDINILEEKIDKTEEYAREIEFLEKYKKKFLMGGMPISYTVFGLEKDKIVTKEEIRNPNFPIQYKGRIEFNDTRNLLRVILSDLNLIVKDQNSIVTNSDFINVFPVKEDEFYEFGSAVVFNNRLIKFVLLKDDREQPIFAIGLGYRNQQ